MQKLFTEMIMEIIGSLIHNWVPLSLAILIAAIMKVYVDHDKLKNVLLRKSKISILASVAVGAFTPLCACGTMAVIIAMLTIALPWGPIMAFLTSSPLMSPEGFIMLAGIINLKFAIALTLASIVIGLGSGYLTHLIEKKTDFLKNQTRFSKKPQVQSCGCSDAAPILEQIQTCSCSDAASIPEPLCCDVQLCCSAPIGYHIPNLTWISAYGKIPIMNIDTDILFGFLKKIKWQEIAESLINVGVKQILLFYSIFVAVGFLINHFVPTSTIVALFSAKNIFAVPLGALIGLPIYISGESSIPLIKTLMAQEAPVAARCWHS